MEPGFTHLGTREWAAVALAVAIIVDWAVHRYVHDREPISDRS